MEPVITWRRDEKGILTRIEGSEDWNDAPDYLNDLNAMAEAENILAQMDYGEVNALKMYRGKLVAIVSGRFGRAFEPSRHEWEMATSASAAQRAEAFLRTIGKWIEHPSTSPV